MRTKLLWNWLYLNYEFASFLVEKDLVRYRTQPIINNAVPVVIVSLEVAQECLNFV
jgi:hypothetical protein